MTTNFSRSYKNYYGALWQYELDTEVVITTTGVFVPISDMSNGDDEGFIFQNGKELKCVKAGKYRVDWNLSFNDGNNKIWQGGVLVNGVVQVNTIGLRKLGATDVGVMGGNGFVRIERDDIIQLGMANLTDTSNAYIDSAHFTIVRVDR